MTRGDIGNYLGLTVETISRLLGNRFQKSGMLAVKGKYITIDITTRLPSLLVIRVTLPIFPDTLLSFCHIIKFF